MGKYIIILGGGDMKFRERIKSTLYSMKNSTKRFPITVFISIIFVIVQIYINEQGYQNNEEIREFHNKISMIIGLGIPLSLCIGFINEVLLKKDKLIEVISYIIGSIILVLYYVLFLNDLNNVSIIRYTGTMIFLILAFFYIPRLKGKEGYEFYVMDVNTSFAITFIYSFVLYFGLAAILFTIDKLFDANIDGKYYYYMFLIVAFIFGVSLFISKLDLVDKKYEDYDYSSAWKILLVYIIIPLITAYTIILYVYFAKIIITWVWPRGLVSNLVLWYSTLSVFIIFSITPILEENKIAKIFKIWFPKVVLPILLMMFMSMFQRTEQYGITENRYYILVLGLWVTGIMLYFSIKKPLRNIVIPITLSLVVLNSVYGPLSAFNISNNSQNKRLNKLLLENELLVEGKLVKNTSITSEGQREISNVIEYFKSSDSLSKIKVFPNDFSTDQMERVLGFPYKPDIYGGYLNEEYFNYYLDPNKIALDIQGFDYYAHVTTWSNENIKIGDMELTYDNTNNTLKLLKGEEILFQEDIKTLVEAIHNKLKENRESNKEGAKLEDMIIEKDYSDVSMRIIFNNISGRQPYGNDNITLDGTEFIILIDKK